MWFSFSIFSYLEVLLFSHSDNHSNIWVQYKLLFSIKIMLGEFFTSIFNGGPWFPDHCSPATLPSTHSDLNTLFSGSYNQHCGSLISHMTTILYPPLQCDFAASPIKIPGLFSYSLKPLTSEHVVESSQDEQKYLSNPQKNEWAQPRLELPSWPETHRK